MPVVQEISKTDLVNIIKVLYTTFNEQKDYLSKLDTEIGDGDHGFSMMTGFTRFHDNLDSYADLSIGQLLKKGGFDLISAIGGAAGAVFGTFFKGQGAYYQEHLDGKESLSLQDLASMMAEALKQIKTIGKAEPGDKTMVDALEPAVSVLAESAANNLPINEAFTNAAAEARQGAENTKNLVGKRGRSKNLGERGVGFIDPGAMSMYFIFKTFADYLNQSD